MKGFSFVAIAAAAIMAFPALASGGPDKERVNGGGQLEEVDGLRTNFSLNAFRDNKGAVKGNIHFGTNPGGQFFINGTPVCLRVDGNQATIVYTDDAQTRPPRPNDGGIVVVEDNGNGNASPGDRLRNGRRTAADIATIVANNCTDPNQPPPVREIRNGNIHVSS